MSAWKHVCAWARPQRGNVDTGRSGFARSGNAGLVWTQVGRCYTRAVSRLPRRQSEQTMRKNLIVGQFEDLEGLGSPAAQALRSGQRIVRVDVGLVDRDTAIEQALGATCFGVSVIFNRAEKIELGEGGVGMGIEEAGR